MPLHFSALEWIAAFFAVLCIGISKSGFTGLSLITVIIMARLFPPRESTGVVLPLLIVGDICAVVAFQRHANWRQIRRMLPPAVVGIVAGCAIMYFIPDRKFGSVIGYIILLLTALQGLRLWKPTAFEHVPHSPAFAWSMGVWSGVTTLLANAAGPIMSLYFLAVNLPKYEFIGTAAWFFLLVNLIKVPFSAWLGLIHGSSLLFNVIMAPAVGLGAFLGQRLIKIVPQRLFEILLVIFAGLASLRLIGLF